MGDLCQANCARGTTPMAYKVQLSVFNGPMDLLLYLIRQNEVDIYDIPIATIADQFVAYLELMKALDIEYAAEFLVLAATLMDLKARMLVPQDPAAEDDEAEELLDPREELVRELLEYKKYHDAAVYLGERFDQRQQRFASGAEPPALDERPLEEIEVWDLFSAFAAILKQIGAGDVEIVSTEVPAQAYMKMILDRLQGEGALLFTQLFGGLRERAAVAGIFLAILELVRLRQIRAVQDREFGEITLQIRRDEGVPAGS